MLEIIISFLAIVTSAFTFVVSYKKLTNKPLNLTISKIFLLTIVALFTMLNNIFNVYFFKIIIGYFLIYLLCNLWFKESNKKTFYNVVVIASIAILLEIIFCGIVSISFGSLEEINKSFMAKTSLTLVCGIGLYFVVLIKPLKQIINKYEIIFLNKVNNGVILGILLLIINVVSIQYSFDYTNKFIYITTIIIIIVSALLIFVIIKENYNQANLEIKYQYLQKSVKNYENMIDDYKELRHNLNADFIAIREISNTKTQKLIDEKIKKYNINYDWIGHIGGVPKGIQGIIYIKLHEMQKRKINVEVNSKLKKDITDRISIKNYAILGDILDITLNNAIEAAEKSPEKAIYIDMLETKNILNIKIINTFKDIIDIDNIGKKNYSTKNRNTGIGLHYLNKIKRKDIHIKKEIINDLFIISLSVPLK